MNVVKLAAMLFAGFVLSAQMLCGAETAGNLIRNPEFKLVKGKLRYWNVRNGKAETMLSDGSQKGVSAVKMPVLKTKSKVFKYGNVFSQTIIIPAAGTYVVTVGFSVSRKFDQTLGKTVNGAQRWIEIPGLFRTGEMEEKICYRHHPGKRTTCRFCH